MKRICVFLGSNRGADPRYRRTTEALGAELARRDIGVVFGGTNVGLMAVLADSALAGGGEVIGVIPRVLADKEMAHPRLSDLKVVETMHERKAAMSQLADGFIALPGGLGTMEEFFEVLTGAQLGFHGKPCGLLNVNGYFHRLCGFLDHQVEEGFLTAEHRAMILVGDNPSELLDRFETYTAPRRGKWIDRGDSD